MRSLPIEVTCLNSLISLKVAHNKLVELSPRLSSLPRLETLDLSNNRLTSLGSVKLSSMHNLRALNLQYNKLTSCDHIPAWICCNLEGNSIDTPSDEINSSYAEMDVIESVVQSCDRLQNGLATPSPSHQTGLSNSRSFASRKSGKGWKRQYYIQQRAREDRLNSSRKVLFQKPKDKCKPCKLSDISSDSTTEVSTPIVGPTVHRKLVTPDRVSDCENSVISLNNDDISSDKEEADVENCSCVASECLCKDDDSHLEVDISVSKSKRHPEGDLDNPKPGKYLKPATDHIGLCLKYNTMSLCGIDDYLPDGFYDAERDRPFLPLKSYEQILHLDSCEIILGNREKDEELDGITLCAQALVYHFKQINGSSKIRGQVRIDNLQVASLLALFVSDHFGGNDKSSNITRMRKSVSGSNYTKPFVCSCPTGSSDSFRESVKEGSNIVEDIVLRDVYERSLQSIKARRNSAVVPIGTLQFGV